MKTLYVEPGSPWQNGRCRELQGSLRDEFGDRLMIDEGLRRQRPDGLRLLVSHIIVGTNTLTKSNRKTKVEHAIIIYLETTLTSLMKYLALLAFCVSVTGPVWADSSPAKVSLTNRKVLWLGDSMPQIGDYVNFVEYYSDKQFPEDKVDIVRIVLSSVTASGLSERGHPIPRPWVSGRSPRALDMVKPKMLIACHGMNDGIYHPQSSDHMAAFRDGINKLISESSAAGVPVVLLTPPPLAKIAAHNLQPNDAPDFGWLAPYKDYDSVLGGCAHWELSLPSSSAYAIDLHTPIDDYLASRRKSDPLFSGIHPNPAGHLLMAEIILKGLGYSIPFDAGLDKELAKVLADPLYSLVKQQRENRLGGWLLYVGYTRDGRFKTDSVDQCEKKNDELLGQIDTIRNKTTLQYGVDLNLIVHAPPECMYGGVVKLRFANSLLSCPIPGERCLLI